MSITAIEVLTMFRVNGPHCSWPKSSVDEDIAIMRAYLDVKMKKLENTMMHQVGYLQCNYGYPASLDLKKPAYYDKMIERYYNG